MSLEVDVLPHQLEFMQARERYVCLTGGFGCGKSFGVGLKAWNLARVNAGYDGMLVSRTSAQLRKLCTEVESVFHAVGCRFIKKGWDEYHLDFGGKTKSVIYLGTTENYAFEKWAGGNLAWVVIDEIDTMPHADQVWKFANDRVRVKAPLLQTACASTPEGYGFLWDFFDRQPRENTEITNRKLIKGCTFDNPFIDTTYVENQIATRDPRTLKAYVYGEFVNLEGVLVYYRYNPEANNTKRTLDSFAKTSPAHVGLDFNKNINAASITVIEDGTPFTVEELYGSTDTDVLMSNLSKTLKDRAFYVYPDASGFEGISQLERAYGKERIRYKKANPPIDRRVAAVNERLAAPSGLPRAFINTEKCPKLANGLLRQVKDAAGKPDKTKGLDHSLDGYGYFVNYLWEVGNNNSFVQGRLAA